MNKTKTTTVKGSFTLNLIFFLVAYVAIVAGIGYWAWLNTLKFENDAITRTQQHLLTIAKSESQRIEEFINTNLFDAKILAKDPLVLKYLKNDIKAKSIPEAGYHTEEYLFEHFKGRVDSIHWLNAKGIVLRGVPFVEEIIGRDESRDPDVKFILENHSSSIDVFKANSGKKFLCFCNPIIENGNFLGLLRVLVSLETINNLVSNVRVGERGYAWVISEQGIMIAHPKPEHRGVDIMAVRKKAFPDFDWSELEGIVSKMKSGEEGIDTYQSAWWTEEKLEIVRKLTAFSPINMSAGQELWSIGISLSYDEIAGPIKRNALNNFIGAGSLLLIFSIGGIVLFRVQRKSAEMEIIARSAEELRVLNEKLQSEITERKKMEEELVKMQKLESVGVLAGGIAHNFNNYLQGILSNIAIVKSHIDSNDKIYINLVESEKAVIQAKQLSKQLLTFSKGGGPIKKGVSIHELIKDSSKFATSGSNIRCELGLPDCSCLIEVDKGQINQVINNLLINARHAMPMGGTIKISVEHYNVEKNDLLPLQEGGYVKITIKDHGTGISQEHLQKIFDPYFTTKETGSGLGLATCFSIIKKHNGYITAESELGVGTTFHIYLPVSNEEISRETVQSEADISCPEPTGGEQVQKKALLEGRRILLMDDEFIISKSVSQQLEKLKYEVKTVKNGTEAIEMYKEAMGTNKSFDAVVMDLTIPGGMGGEEAIKELLKIDPDVAAIVASGYSKDPIMTNFGEYGFKGVVEKPYEIYELEEVLQKVIMEK